MIKRVSIVLITVFVVLAIVFALKLVQLHEDISKYAAYWNQNSENGSFTYVALGDSAAQGIGASKPQLGYVGLLANHIELYTGQKVKIINLSVSGAKIKDVIDKQIPQLKHLSPNLVTVEIGSNDVENNFEESMFQSQYQALAEQLPPGTLVSNIPYFGGRSRKNSVAIIASNLISNSASTHNLKLVDLQKYTHEHQSILNYAADFFHPSDRGYKNWEAAFWQQVVTVLPNKK